MSNVHALSWHLVMHMVLSGMPAFGLGGMGWHGSLLPADKFVAVVNNGWQIEHRKQRKK